MTIQNLPKYDSYGYEITYYAKEVMNIDKEAFDYQDVYYKVRSTDSANPSPVVIGDGKNGLQDGVADETLVAPLSGSDGANIYLLKEDLGFHPLRLFQRRSSRGNSRAVACRGI